MVNMNWCLKQKKGIRLVESNDNLAKAYIEMSIDSINVMNNERKKSLRWAVSSCYYSMYYSLYAILMKIGIKCEIHSCTIKFMESSLKDFYSKEDINIINKAFELRNIIQYYADKLIDEKDAELIFKYAPIFFNHSKEILSRLNQDKIKEIRKGVTE
ncbi:MAG TPA: HEPN domain-containing protein [Candidatus Pacearchaeota archaeon]|nr:HEPN domain protein [archaeon BMS3Abin17]HDK42574.1 HEPN domain-containing protein [Candidatus Pacearchaeota archaeon]